MRIPCLVLVLAASPAWAQLPITFDRYHTYDEMTAFLREAEGKYPDLARLSSVGRSYLGREIWLLELTNRKTGAPEEKPALYVNGCLDSSEVVTTEGVLYSIKALLEGYGKDKHLTEILDTRTLYMVPRVLPDQTELYLTTPQNARSLSAEPTDEDGDGGKDEDPDDDLDGDGHVVQMRVKDLGGAWKVSDKDARLLVRRRPEDREGVFYRVLPEGRDDDGDGRYNEDRVGGIDPNRNYPGHWAPPHTQRGAGPYPLYVQETRAEVEFLERHRNVAAYINHHSSGGVILRPSTTHDDGTTPESDLRLLRQIAASALDATGYWLATSVYDWRYPPGSSDTKPGQTWRRPDGTLANDPREGGGPFGPGGFGGAPADALRGRDVGPDAEGDGSHAYLAFGGSIEYTYELLGIVSYASEQWRAAHDHDTDRNGTISDLERLDWNDKKFGGSLFVNWTPFKHPQLGEVEIGGWKKFTTSSPPPGKYLEDECQRQLRVNLLLADLLPRVRIREAKAEDLGGGVYRVTAKVANAGVIPTATQMAVKLGRARPVTATLAPDPGVELLGTKAEVSLGHLEGRGEPASAEWIVRVRGAGEAAVTITAAAENAGRATARVSLGGKTEAGR